MGIGKQRVPPEGDEDANIMVVGEAPGGEEVGQGRPFVGRSGQLLERYLGRHGIPRSDVWLTNLSKHKPGLNHNNFRALLKSDELKSGLEELKEEIQTVQPNIILALGNWPMWFLTGESLIDKRTKKKQPGSGIMSFRGSRLRTLPEWGDEIEVFCSLHPAAILRNWVMNPVFNLDIIHMIEDSFDSEIRLPVYEEYIDPGPDILIDLVQEAMNSGWISLDIETFPNPPRYSCVGWAWNIDGVDKGCTITFQSPGLARYAREIWECDVPKILQYGTYDIPFMKRFHGWEIGGYYDNVGRDTYVASASLLPDYPRKLEFLCSILTRFPYYKDDRKIWKEKDDLDILWRYNIKDCVATHQIAMRQMKEIGELFS